MDAEVERSCGRRLSSAASWGGNRGRESAATPHAIAVYYVIATAEHRPTWRALTACVRIARGRAEDVLDMYGKTRAQGFGAEVKRGSFWDVRVSSGYHDAYYLRRKRSHLIRGDSKRHSGNATRSWRRSRRRRPTDRRERRHPLQMYLGDIFTVPVNLAGICGLSVPCGFTAARLPVGLQIWARRSRKRTFSGLDTRTSRRPRGTGKTGVMKYLTTIGLEVHVQFEDALEMFCACRRITGPPTSVARCPAIPVPSVMNEEPSLTLSG